MSSLKKIQGQPSWTFRTSEVEAAVTRQGGHLAPVRFRIGKDRWVEPFEVAPWAEEKLAPGTPELMKAMRGDFLAVPHLTGERSTRLTARRATRYGRSNQACRTGLISQWKRKSERVALRRRLS